MRGGWGLALTGLLCAGCGGVPGTHSPTAVARRAPPPWRPPARQPALVEIAATLVPAGLARAIRRLTRADVHGVAPAGLAAAATTLDTVPWSALGLSARAPMTLTVRTSPPTAVLRATEDLSRVLADPPAGGLDAWLLTHPLPPAWVHVRIVGAPATPAADADTQLSAWLGALQRFSLTEAPETAAAALEVPPAALSGVSALGASRCYRLLARDLPTLLRVEAGPDATVVDLLVDLALGEGALLAGLQALPELAGSPSAFAPPSPPLDRGVVGQAALAADRWAALVLVLDRAAALWPVLGDNPLRQAPAEVLAQGLARVAQRAAALAGGASAQVTFADADGGARLTVTGPPPAGGPPAPGDGALSLADLLSFGAWAIRWSPTPAGPPISADAHARLGAALRCGAACWPTLWGRGPADVLARPSTAAEWLAAAHPTAAALSTVRHLGVALDGDGAPTLAAVATAGANNAPWQAALPPAQAQVARPGGSLRIGAASPTQAQAALARVAWAPAPWLLAWAGRAADGAQVSGHLGWDATGQQRLDWQVLPAEDAPGLGDLDPAGDAWIPPPTAPP